MKNTKAIAKIFAIVLAIAMVLTSFGFAFIFSSAATSGNPRNYTSAEIGNDKLDTALFESYINFIHENYKDYVTYEDLLDGAFAGIIDALDDPYSVYYETADQGQTFMQNVNNTYVGIGITAQQEGDYVKIVSVAMDSSAEKAGIKAGDIIKAVNGESVKNKELAYVTGKLKDGKEGSKVSVTVESSGVDHTYTLERMKLGLASLKYDMLDDNIAYLYIQSFDSDTDKEFRAAINDLREKGMKALIVDIRNNHGGIISSATGVASQMMDFTSVIMSYEKQGKTVQNVKSNGNGVHDVPIVLLVNEYSASAAEILAGAWQDNKIATLVGTTTYGKGVAQQVATISNGQSIKLSMYYFVTPLGHEIQKVGITPDYVVENKVATGSKILQDAYATFAPMTEEKKCAKGDTSLNVYGAQQRLSMLGYDVKLSATMDDATIAAIKAFQTANGLYAYPVLDYTTMSKLNTAAYDYAYGVSSEDLQLRKALEILDEAVAKAAKNSSEKTEKNM